MTDRPPVTGRVCIVTPGYISSTPRVVKEAEALSQAGYRVRVVFSQGDLERARQHDSIGPWLTGRGDGLTSGPFTGAQRCVTNSPSVYRERSSALVDSSSAARAGSIRKLRGMPCTV